MSALTRLTLITHAMTEAVARARFPADEPLNTHGQQALSRAGHFDHRAGLLRAGPEVRTTQTAHLLGLDAVPEPALRDLGHGRWSGTTMDELAPEQLMGWLADPEFRAHDGESLVDLIARVRAWLDSVADTSQRVVAVTHPAVVRAAVLIALHAPPTSFWRIDIAPLSATTLHHRGGAWTLRGTAQPL